jgi:hypothetical protein
MSVKNTNSPYLLSLRRNFLTQYTDRRSRVVNTPASYSGVPGFKSYPGYRLTWSSFVVVFLSPWRQMPGKFLEFSHDRFPTQPFLFTVHLLSYIIGVKWTSTKSWYKINTGLYTKCFLYCAIFAIANDVKLVTSYLRHTNYCCYIYFILYLFICSLFNNAFSMTQKIQRLMKG